MEISMSRPKAREDLKLEMVGREGLLYDREGDLIHMLNVTALEIWKACDGENDEEAIELRMKSRFSGVRGHDVSEDVRSTLNEFEQRGLLEKMEG